MTFKPEEFLEFAVKIHSEPDLQSPAGVRTAISRCYYSALLSAVSSLERSGVELPKSDAAHEVVVRTLSRGSSAACRGLGDDLASMNEMRIAADLNVDSLVGIDVLGHALATAKMFRDDLGRCFSPQWPS